jgi:hypothetical protein
MGSDAPIGSRVPGERGRSCLPLARPQTCLQRTPPWRRGGHPRWIVRHHNVAHKGEYFHVTI